MPRNYYMAHSKSPAQCIVLSPSAVLCYVMPLSIGNSCTWAYLIQPTVFDSINKVFIEVPLAERPSDVLVNND